MREDFWEFPPTHKLHVATNHLPEIRGTDKGIWRRVKTVPFNVTFSAAEQDKELPEKLADETSGILAWAVQGCLNWQRDGLAEPLCVALATLNHREEMDLLGGFLQDHCVIDANAQAPIRDLYRTYTDWCTDTGEAAETQIRFSKAMRARGFVRGRGTGASGTSRAYGCAARVT